ncbi:MAG: ABC transporter ATP-binding protein [Butyricicoccus sp.]|nr:ABC transporter ATP-binding protein [Butyricicoccus sp.]
MPLLEVKNLSVSFDTPRGELQAVRDVSFSLDEGEILAIVGESGCGKSVLCKAATGLLPDVARIKSGSVVIDGEEVSSMGERRLRERRGRLFSMILQDPMGALNPGMGIGAQIAEAVRVHSPRLPRGEVRARVLELLELVGIDRAGERYALYPHNLSGGQRQRVVMAIALAGRPRLLFADEPTTALDARLQAQILDLLREIRRSLGTATVLVSHDLGAVARAADRVAVMYAGRIVEIGTADEVFYDPRHPYTWSLLLSLPSRAVSGEPLRSIPGMPPAMIDPPPGDAFAPRNPWALEIDYEQAPHMFCVSETHCAATWLLDERAPKTVPPLGGGRDD